MDASLDKALEGMLDFARSFKPEDIIVSEETARGMAMEIEAAIPADARVLYPEDPLLAAIAYAPVYFELHPLYKR